MIVDFGATPGKVRVVKTGFDDLAITIGRLELPEGGEVAEGIHVFVIQAFETPDDHYDVELDLDGEPVLCVLRPGRLRRRLIRRPPRPEPAGATRPG